MELAVGLMYERSTDTLREDDEDFLGVVAAPGTAAISCDGDLGEAGLGL